MQLAETNVARAWTALDVSGMAVDIIPWGSVEGRKARLAHLDRHGDSDHAFGWSHPPHVKPRQARRRG